MVINHSTPGFGGLAETGWAALGAATRGQTFILYVPLAYKYDPPGFKFPGAGKYIDMLDDYAGRTRYLVVQHAKRFQEHIDGLIVAENIEDVLKALQERYGRS